MRSFKARVQELANLFGGPRELSRLSGIPRRTIANWLAGTSKPRHDQLLRLSVAADVSLEWLASGEGEMRDTGATPEARLQYHSAALASELRAQEPAPPALRSGYVYLPLYDVRAAAGGGALVESEAVVDALAFKESWIREELHAAPADLRLIHVEGDSMEPDLRAGDIILIDHTDKGRREGIYVLRLEDALLVKQLQRLPGGVLRVISKNPAYEPFTITTEQIGTPSGPSIIGRVVWACRRL